MPYVTNGDIKLYYESVGQGYPIILQTGGGGDGSMWRDGGYVAGLDGFHCILLDHRGHGRSDAPAALDDYRMERFVADVVALLDALALPRAAFWGYSAGAHVGYALAAAHPQRVAALVASGVIDSPDETTPAAREETAAYARQVRTEGMPYLVRSYESAPGGQPMTPWFRQQMLDTDPNAFAQTLFAWNEWPGPWPLLQRITCPALLLVGEREDPNGDTARAAALMPNARCVTFAGLDHITAYERSDLALAEALPFLHSLRLG